MKHPLKTSLKDLFCRDSAGRITNTFRNKCIEYISHGQTRPEDRAHDSKPRAQQGRPISFGPSQGPQAQGSVGTSDVRTTTGRSEHSILLGHFGNEAAQISSVVHMILYRCVYCMHSLSTRMIVIRITFVFGWPAWCAASLLWAQAPSKQTCVHKIC